MIRRSAALLALSLGLVACGEPVDTGDGRFAYPEDPDSLILRMSTAGGFVPFTVALQQLPEFSLLGDGRVISVAPQIEIYPPPALPGLTVRRIDEGGILSVLEAARQAGLFRGDRRYEYPFVADAGTTTFTLVAGGGKHVVSVYALGIEDGAGLEEPPPDGEGAAPGPTLPPDELEARRALASFRDLLFDLQSWLPEGAVGPEELLRPDRVRVYVVPPVEAPEPGLEQPEVAWPLDAPLAGFGTPLEGSPDVRCGAVSGAELETLLPLFERANELTPWKDASGTFHLVLRPLLPDEPGCPEDFPA